MKRIQVVALLVMIALVTAGAHAALLLEIDTDGVVDTVVTYNPLFSFGGDTTTYQKTSATSTAFGTTGGDSIYGGNGSEGDTYLYTYTPGSNADNLTLSAGQDLGAGNLASGLVGGAVGTYRVYATWTYSTNVSGGLTKYTVSTDDGATSFSVQIDQNFKGNEWILLGDINFSDPASSIIVTQESGANTYVSMRAYGMLFEMIPEPATLALLGLGGLMLRSRRRR
jgi:hypothetical protein